MGSPYMSNLFATFVDDRSIENQHKTPIRGVVVQGRNKNQQVLATPLVHLDPNSKRLSTAAQQSRHSNALVGGKSATLHANSSI